MGYFSENASYSSGADFEVAEDGVYGCRLTEIKKEARASFEDPLVMIDQFRFTFETISEADSNGMPFKFMRFTGVKYGNDKANFTKLLDSMLGKRLTPDEFNELDLSDLTAKKWRVCVEATVNQKGGAINKISWVKPQGAPTGGKPGVAAPGITAPSTATNRPRPGVTPEDEVDYDGEDPFEESKAPRGRGVAASAL